MILIVIIWHRTSFEERRIECVACRPYTLEFPIEFRVRWARFVKRESMVTRSVVVSEMEIIGNAEILHPNPELQGLVLFDR